MAAAPIRVVTPEATVAEATTPEAAVAMIAPSTMINKGGAYEEQSLT